MRGKAGESACPTPVRAGPRPYVCQVEQPRTRIPRPSPTDAGGGSPRPSRSSADRAADPAGNRPGRPTRPGRPAAKLTGFGAGVVGCATTLLGGVVNRMFSDDLGVFFGVVFVGASLAGALWVRHADLAAAPVCAPIAFALGVAVTGDDGGGGVLGHITATVTGLATLTGWLYAGTLVAAAVAAVRRFGPRRPGRGRAARP
jgi:hypothetical protein